MRTTPTVLLLLPSCLLAALSAQTYPARRVTNGCFVTANSFTTTNRVLSLSVIQTGDVHVVVQGENVLRRFNASGGLGYTVPTTAGPVDCAATSTGDCWVVSQSGNTLQRITPGGTLGGTFGSAVAGVDPVAVAAISAGGGGIGDAWIVNGSPRLVRRVAFTGVLSWSRAVPGTPVDVCAHTTADSWVVMLAPNQLQRFAANGTPGGAIALTGTPVAVDVDAAGNVAVVTTGPNELRSFSLNGTARYTVALPAAPAGVVIDPSGNPALTLPARGELRRYAFTNGSLLCTASVPHQPGALDVNAGNGDFWVGSEPPPNPTPALTTLTPNNALAGSAGFTLTIDGTGFFAGSVVRWNGSDLTTQLGSSTRVTATIVAARIASPGTANVTVFNPPPGGGLSNALPFRIGIARAAATPYGTGCAGTGGGGAVPLLAVAGLPRLGTTYRLDLSMARAQSAASFFVGISRTTWLGLPLPLPLVGFGAPSCTLLASGEVQLRMNTSVAGVASLSIPVPNDMALANSRLYHQVVIADVPANTLGLVFTRGMEVLVGDL